MGNVAASGGFYIAMACPLILAEPGTLTGSIGVISQFPNVKGLVERFNVKVETLKSGKLKDAGNPFRDMTPEDRAYWQSLIDQVYAQFVGAVAEGRELPEEEVRKIADGRVITGQQAQELGLDRRARELQRRGRHGQGAGGPDRGAAARLSARRARAASSRSCMGARPLRRRRGAGRDPPRGDRGRRARASTTWRGEGRMARTGRTQRRRGSRRSVGPAARRRAEATPATAAAALGAVADGVHPGGEAGRLHLLRLPAAGGRGERPEEPGRPPQRRAPSRS